MIENDLGFDGFDATESHLTQPLALGFVHQRLWRGLKGYGSGGIRSAIEGFTSPGRTDVVVPGGRRPGVPGVPGGPTGTWSRTFVGPAGVGIGGPYQVGPCTWPMSWDPIQGKCRIDLDPGAGTGLPFMGPQVEPGGEVEGQGIVYPNPTERLVQECPKMPNGKKGILWMGMQDGVVVCLPTGVNGKPMGYMRKNKPRRKAFITAAQVGALRKHSNMTKKAKEFAKLTGQSCKPRGRGR